MPRFADSKEIVKNEDIEPIDVIYRKYVEDQQPLSSKAECYFDTVET